MDRHSSAVNPRIRFCISVIPFFFLLCNVWFCTELLGESGGLKAGFSRVCITPPLGTGMTGFGDRDYDKGCVGIHDELYLRTVYLTDGKNEIVIMGYDLLFFSRAEADRIKGAVGAVLDLSPKEILLNTSHNHTGPKVGTWYYSSPEPFYFEFLLDKIKQSAREARNTCRDVTLWAGAAKTSAPMNRRKPMSNGAIDMRPNPEGFIFDKIPVCLLKDNTGMPVCLLFSVACHPSTIKGDDRAYWISADYPGAAMKYIDEYLGSEASLFLQGAGGDSKLAVIGEGQESWRSGTWEDVDRAGKSIAEDVIQCIASGLKEAEPNLSAALTEIVLPLQPPMKKAEYERLRDDKTTIEPMRRWAEEQVSILEKGYCLPGDVPVLIHGIMLANSVRIVGIEGEIVAELGALADRFYDSGVTFPLGYTDGAQLYIPTSAMIDEGGYEVESYWEYRYPAPLKKGIEEAIRGGLMDLQERGIR